MPLPPQYEQVLVTGTYLASNSVPCQGVVTLVAPVPVTVGGVIVEPWEFVAVLDPSGHFELLVPASSDPDITPTGWTYTVREELCGRCDSYSVQIIGPGPIDLSTLTRIPPIIPSPVVTSVNGMTGAVVLPDDHTWSLPGAITAQTGGSRIHNDTGRPLLITGVRSAVGTAPSGGPLTVDVNLDASTIFPIQADRPSIPAGSHTSGPVPRSVTWPPASFLTVDVDTAPTSAEDLTVTITAH